MEQTERESWTRDLVRRVGASHRPAPMRHVMDRVAAVLAPAAVRYVDNGLDNDEAGGVSGRIVVFTDDVVAVVDVQGVASTHSHGGALNEGTTTVAFVPRRSLKRVDIGPGAHPAVNTGEAWASEQARDGWPWAGQMTLTYDSLADAVLLPSGDADAFGAFVPDLLRDLAAARSTPPTP